MPELPEVETVRRGLISTVVGRAVQKVEARRVRLREPLPPDLHRRLRGRTVLSVSRRGKYLLVEVGEVVWIVHLGMSGQLFYAETPPRRAHVHVVVRFEEGGCLVYVDPRRFGRMALTTPPTMGHPWLAGLGPEPLTAAFNGRDFCRRLRGRNAPIKTVLLDGGVVAGVGNIYASESLFVAGIRPQTPASRLGKVRVERLVTAVKTVLRRAIRAGGSSLRDFVGGDGRPGYFQMRWAVYGREGAPCRRCDGRVRLLRQGGRSSYYCPRCQR